MPHKLFESEVGKSLQALGSRCFALKPLDGVMWAAERVDFHCTIDGFGVQLEAKEIPSETKFLVSKVAKNQVNCLEATERAKGFGLLLVNFGRKRGATPAERSRGFMAVYRIAPGYLTGRIHLLPEDAFATAFPKGGGLWDFEWMDLLTRGALVKSMTGSPYATRVPKMSPRPIVTPREGIYADGGHIIRRGA